MRVIVKEPGLAPYSTELSGDVIAAMRDVVGGSAVSCLSGPGVKAWCDYDAHAPTRLNLRRPTDGAPVHGAVVVTGMNGPEVCSLSDRQCALWLATLALIGVDESGVWRDRALEELVPRLDRRDSEMFHELGTRTRLAT